MRSFPWGWRLPLRRRLWSVLGPETEGAVQAFMDELRHAPAA